LTTCAPARVHRRIIDRQHRDATVSTSVTALLSRLVTVRVFGPL